MKKKIYFSLFGIFFCQSFLTFQVVFCQADDQITNLPGLNEKINFSQYAGYINVDKTNNRNLFYWFVESQNNPITDPLLLWLNGGPGASSLLGFLTENGPFRPQSDGQNLFLNPYSWNLKANIIFLEAPAFVGFSYSDNASDVYTDDDKTASDNYQFLLNWFQKFPSFKDNDFYITGESYGGHYVPELANLVLEGNKKGAGINIKGIAIGNPGIENDWYSHGLLPQKAYTDSVSACGWDDFLKNCTKNFFQPSPACIGATNQALSYIPSNINFYDIYSPVCHNSSQIDNFHKYVSYWNPIFKQYIASKFPFAPCAINYMTAYLNQPQVQKAIHARPTKWSWIGNIHYGNKSRVIVPYFEKFFNETDWKILIFSGDTDSSVPFIGTQRWISCLGRPVKQDWYNWVVDDQIAGSVITYDKITFLTVKGVGHMVPYFSPKKGFELFSRWISNQPF